MGREEFIKALQEENERHNNAMKKINRQFLIWNIILVVLLAFAIFYPHVY